MGRTEIRTWDGIFLSASVAYHHTTFLLTIHCLVSIIETFYSYKKSQNSEVSSSHRSYVFIEYIPTIVRQKRERWCRLSLTHSLSIGPRVCRPVLATSPEIVCLWEGGKYPSFKTLKRKRALAKAKVLL